MCSGEAHENFRLFLSTLILQVLIFNMNYHFIATGKGKESGILVMLRRLFLFVPLVLVPPMVRGVEGAWIVIPVCDVLTVVIVGVMLMREYCSQRSSTGLPTGA